MEKGEHVLTLVPEQFSYEFDQKLYRILGPVAFNQLETHSFKSLARAVFQRYGCVPDGKTNADELTKMALLYEAVLYTTEREHMLRILEKQCRQSSFVEELSTLFALFRRSGITPELLYDSCAALDGRLLDKTLDLFRIYQKYDQLLMEHHLKDTETELTEAAAIANGQDAFLGDVLCLDEFESFTEDEYEMLTVLFSSCKEVYVALRTDSTDPVPFSLFETVQDTLYRIKRIASELHIPVSLETCETPYRFQSGDLRWLSQHVFRSSQPFSSEPQHLHILEAATPNEEAEYVCATIRRLLAENPALRCRDIAVLTNQMSDYESILETAMDRYELPYHVDEKQSVLYTPLMVYLHTVLELLRAKRPDTELLLRLGKTGLTNCTAGEMAELENYCYTWQIDGNTWNEPFTGGRCETAEKVRKKLLLPIENLRKASRKPHTGGEYCRLLYDFMGEQKVEERLNEQLLAIQDEQKRMQTREEWAHVWNSLMDILDHMALLYESLEMAFPEFCAVLASLTRSVKRAVPPRTLDAVLISQGSTARLNAPKIVFLLGVCEGTFPALPGGSAIFSERDCLTLEQMKLPVVKSKEVQLADARLAAYKLLSSASHALYLTYPCVNITHQKCYPSSVIAQIQRMFPEGADLKQTCGAQGSAYYAGTLHAAYYEYVQNYTENTPETASIAQVLLEEPLYAGRLRKLSELTAKQTEDPDAPLFHIDDKKLMQDYIGNTLQLSASGLERYQYCPFSYFCNDILRLYSRQKIRLAGAGSGSLIHSCLERLLREYDKDAFLRMTPAQLRQVISGYAAEFWQAEMGGDFSKNGRELAAYRHTVEGMLPLLLHMQEEFRQSAFSPYCMELQITPENQDFPPLHLLTGDGQQIRLVGKIDRVDVCQDGDKLWVRVVDYKSGVKDFSLGNLLYGLDLQMLIYLFSITAPGTPLADASPAGVLYMPSGMVKSDLKRGSGVTPQKQCNDTYRMKGILLRDPHLITLMEQEGRGIYIPGKLDGDQQLDSRSGTFLTAEQMRHLRQYVLRRLTDAAEGIYHGEIDAFPLQLQQHNPCSYCSYANICGNSNEYHGQIAGGTQVSREKQMMELLDSMEQEEEENH